MLRHLFQTPSPPKMMTSFVNAPLVLVDSTDIVDYTIILTFQIMIGRVVKFLVFVLLSYSFVEWNKS